VLSGRGLCDELITRQEESYRLCCVVVCDLKISRIGAPYVYDISSLRVKEMHCAVDWRMTPLIVLGGLCQVKTIHCNDESLYSFFLFSFFFLSFFFLSFFLPFFLPVC
jgi:hypothetical protein